MDCVARDTFGTNISCNPLYTCVCQIRKCNTLQEWADWRQLNVTGPWECSKMALLWGGWPLRSVWIQKRSATFAADFGNVLFLFDMFLQHGFHEKLFKCTLGLSSADDMPRSGRPRVTSNADDRYLTLASLRNRITPATTLRADLQRRTGQRVNTQTARNRLRVGGLRGRRPRIGVILTASTTSTNQGYLGKRSSKMDTATMAVCTLHRWV